MSVSVKEIVIPSDTLENIRKIQKSKTVWFTRRDRLKAAAGFSPFCCVCHEITSPLYEVRYSVGGAIRREIYCPIHYESVYHKTKDSTSEELAAKYNCQIVEEVPPTIRNPWD